MSTAGYGWEDLRQVCATLLGARHVPERLCGGLDYLGRLDKCSPLPFYLLEPESSLLTAVICGFQLILRIVSLFVSEYLSIKIDFTFQQISSIANTRSSATAEKQRGSCACVPRLAN